MENASKALIMAGGVLIGILIISLAVYLFIDFGSTSAEINTQRAQKQIAEFNSKFTAYETYKDNNGKWQITIYDIVSLASYAIENNEYYKDVEDEQINVIVDGNSALQYKDNYKKLINENTMNGVVKFKCEKIEYNNRGKVKSISFIKEM